MRRTRSHLGVIGTRGGILSAVSVSGILVGVLATGQDRAPSVLVGVAGLVAIVAWMAALLLFRRLVDAEEVALRDPLTGLPNRLLLDDRIEQAIVRAERSEEAFAILAIDLDGFKEVNDIRGHEAGDQVLVATGARLGAIVRASDTVSRIGGDEFVVLSLGTRTEEEAAHLVTRIRAEIRAPYVVSGGLVEIDASVGIALFPDGGGSPVELLAQADSKMFESKRGAHAHDAPKRRGSLDVGIVREFEKALENDELVVHFQPIVEITTGVPVAAEALVRRVHPERGLVTPAEFLPHVERTSVMRELTLFVLGQAYAEVVRWRGLGRELTAHVNVPLRMIDDPVLAEGLAGLAIAHGVGPGRITLEVAAAGTGSGAELDRDVLVELRRRGARLALDDFGRGSSLAALRILPLDEVKVDASFVRDIGTSRASDAILGSLVNLAHDLGMTATAEGVESRSGLEALRGLSYDRVQGYVVNRPLPGDAFAEWLRTAAFAVAS